MEIVWVVCGLLVSCLKMGCVIFVRVICVLVVCILRLMFVWSVWRGMGLLMEVVYLFVVRLVVSNVMYKIHRSVYSVRWDIILILRCNANHVRSYHVFLAHHPSHPYVLHVLQDSS